MDNPFTSIKTYPAPEGVAIQWTLDTTFREDLPHNYTLEIAEVPTFSELVYSKDQGDTFIAYDDSSLHKSLNDDWYYRVKLVTGLNNTYYSGIVQLGSSEAVTTRAYLVAAEIVRKEFVRMRYTGLNSYLLKRKTAGPIDTAQVDEVSGVAMSDNNDSHGVGIIGGYYAPISFAVSREQVQQDRKFQQEGLGVSDEYSYVFRCAGFPSVEVRDVIALQMNNQRFNILNVKTTFFPSTTIPIIQVCQCKLIAPTDTIYNIAIDYTK